MKVNINYLIPKFKHLLFLLKNKIIEYIYNLLLHFFAVYGTKNHLLIKFLHWFEPYPVSIEIEVTTKCNLRCIMCEHTYWKEPARNMSFEKFKSIIDQFPNLKWIGLTGIGESFLNKDFLKMLEYVKSKNIFVELYDNFYFINKKIAKELIGMGIDKIFVSLDAATKETYEKIRVGSNFEKVINNLKNILQLKKKNRAFSPEIAFHYVINRFNFQEILQYIELVRSLTNENISIQFTRMLHKFKEVKDLFVEIPKETIKLTERKAKELGIKLTWNANVPQIKPPLTKCTEWIMPFIFVTGHVIPCCSANEAGRREFQKETALGNIFKQSFKEIWYGEKYKSLRKTLNQGKVPLSCKNCCLYETKIKNYDFS